MEKYTAFQIANILIKLAQNDADCNGGDSMTNMKLQKLLYYEQGYHLAAFGKPLFTDNIESWMYGPVVPEVYEKYKQYGSSPLIEEDDNIKLNKDTRDLFIQVYDTYKDYSAIGLMNLTHKENPWIEAVPHIKGTIIKYKSMEEYFKTMIE